tara:strand:+ start:327 stop:548 length:222 start_codon:yes stop_codon:yes gene_type:complete
LILSKRGVHQVQAQFEHSQFEQVQAMQLSLLQLLHSQPHFSDSMVIGFYINLRNQCLQNKIPIKNTYHWIVKK